MRFDERERNRFVVYITGKRHARRVSHPVRNRSGQTLGLPGFGDLEAEAFDERVEKVAFAESTRVPPRSRCRRAEPCDRRAERAGCARRGPSPQAHPPRATSRPDSTPSAVRTAKLPLNALFQPGRHRRHAAGDCRFRQLVGEVNTPVCQGPVRSQHAGLWSSQSVLP